MQVRVVLVGTTHPGNIGAVARAMKNMGLTDLALVRPKLFPHEEATARASGAEDVLDQAIVVDTVQEAVADCLFVAGASARARSIDWPMLEPRPCAERLIAETRHGPVAVVFGPEKSGLTNADLDLCHVLLTIPTDPNFSSLNLAMAVQVVSYELRLARAAEAPVEDPPEPGQEDSVPLATAQELEHFYRHLERMMERSGFLDPDNPRLLMRRLRRLFVRAAPDQNEINILRGVLASFERRWETERSNQ
ncbi:MAG: tRNA (cytosine(32)/uridine(32)-2'-O)-methyltransferase TrmJ [Pseudomonadota bacterium]